MQSDWIDLFGSVADRYNKDYDDDELDVIVFGQWIASVPLGPKYLITAIVLPPQVKELWLLSSRRCLKPM